ncbi:MAG TPA: SPFH domain-containing protein, partial [Myxococcaceae bacterium]|nr:SPFH domain-containing protein [Myxococcaceae bacterium]
MADPRLPIDLRAASQRIFGTPRGRRVYLLAGGLFLVLVAYGLCTVYVHPGERGVKQVIVGSTKGILPEIYHPGIHWVSPGTERMHLFPSDIQILNLTNDASERGKAEQSVRPALNIQTSEGYTVSVDVSVAFRVEDPYRVITVAGPGRLYEESLVFPRVEQILRKRLGELDAEQFYDVRLRTTKVRAAFEEMNRELLPNGVRVVQVFVRRYIYDARYQQAIEQRKIQDQTVFKNKAEAELATATAERDRIAAVGAAAVKVELARGDGEKKKLEAEADLYSRKRHAAGELAVQLAEAEGTRLENEALRGVGAENLVGLKMADVLRGTRIIVVPTDGEAGF